MTDEDILRMKVKLGVLTAKEPHPDLLIAVRVRHLLYFSSYAFETVGTLRNVAMMGDNDKLLVEADRLTRQLRCEVGELIP
jgi:hypothetical protein